MFLFDWIVADFFTMIVAKLKKLILYQKEDYVLHVVTCYWVTICFVQSWIVCSMWSLFYILGLIIDETSVKKMNI